MSEIRHIFQRLAFELKGLGLKDPIEIYVSRPGYFKLENELMASQRIPDGRNEKGILLYDAVRILLKEDLEWDRGRLERIQEKVVSKLVLLAKQIEQGAI